MPNLTTLRHVAEALSALGTTLGTVFAKIRDTAGNAITSTTGWLDVNVKGTVAPATSHATNGHGYGAGAITNVSATDTIGLDAADANSAAIPDHCLLSALDMAFDTVVAATSVRFYLSEDAAGLYPVSHPVTVTLQPSATAARYVVSYLINREYRRSAAAGAAGTLYLHWYLDAGTANGVARLRFLP